MGIELGAAARLPAAVDARTIASGAVRLMPALPALVALAVNLWGLAGPTLWRDEAATLSAAGRPFGDLLAMLGDIDAVHGAYYLFMQVWTGAFGTGPTAVRLPSVLGLMLAAAATAALGRRLADPWTGLWAGLLVAASPLLSRYGQEARQYAIATAIAAVSSYLLVRAVQSGTRPWPWIAYAFSVTLVGWIHLFTLLLLPVHAIALLTVRPRRAVLGRWAIAALQGLSAVVPVALIALPQSGRQVSWITAPDGEQVSTLLWMMAGGSWLVSPVLLLAVLGLWRRPGTALQTPDGEIDLRLLGLAWAVVPPALLLGVSLIEPYYVLRYVIFCTPGLALLVAAGLRRLPLWGALPALVALLLAGLPLHLDVRGPYARPDDLRTLAGTVQAGRQPGDAIIFHRELYRRVMAAYPDTFDDLRDVALDKTAAQARDLQSTDIADRTALLARLRGVRRIWYVDNYALPASTPPPPEDEIKEEVIKRSRMFRRVGRWRFKGGAVSLYVRR